jgi:hypothetical protein
MQRQTKVSVLKIVLENDNQKQNLKDKSLQTLLNCFRKLPIKLQEDAPSRYSSSQTGNEQAIIFSDEIKTDFLAQTDITIGAFLKRRGNNRPWEDDGEGNLIELTLPDETHEIAEVSFFGIDIYSGILFWTYNPLVGGLNQFSNYLNKKLRLLNSSGLLENIQEGYLDSKQLGFYYIGYPDSIKIFEDKMEQIQKLEFHIAGDPDFLDQSFLFNDDSRDRTGMKLLSHLSKESNCATIKISLGAERAKKVKIGKNRTETKYFSLNKQFIMNFYYQTIDHLRTKKESKFNVQGKVIDEDLRVLDLVHSRLTYPLVVEIGTETDIFSNYIKQFYKLIQEKKEEARRYYGYEVD